MSWLCGGRVHKVFEIRCVSVKRVTLQLTRWLVCLVDSWPRCYCVNHAPHRFIPIDSPTLLNTLSVLQRRRGSSSYACRHFQVPEMSLWQSAKAGHPWSVLVGKYCLSSSMWRDSSSCCTDTSRTVCWQSSSSQGAGELQYWLCLDTRSLYREYDMFYAIVDVMSISNADDCNNWRITIFKV